MKHYSKIALIVVLALSSITAQAQWQQANETNVDASYRLYLASVAYLKAAGRLVE